MIAPWLRQSGQLKCLCVAVLETKKLKGVGRMPFFEKLDHLWQKLHQSTEFPD